MHTETLAEAEAAAPAGDTASPSSTPQPQGSFALTRDYQKILRRLPELLTEDGVVLACVNDPAIGPDFLVQGMATEAPELRFVERLENPPEFADIDEDAGLKALVFRRG